MTAAPPGRLSAALAKLPGSHARDQGLNNVTRRKGPPARDRRPGAPAARLVRKFDAQPRQIARSQRYEPTDPAAVIKVRPTAIWAPREPHKKRIPG